MNDFIERPPTNRQVVIGNQVDRLNDLTETDPLGRLRMVSVEFRRQQQSPYIARASRCQPVAFARCHDRPLHQDVPLACEVVRLGDAGALGERT